MSKHVYTVDVINIPNVKEWIPFTLSTYNSEVFESLKDAKDYLVWLKDEWMKKYRLNNYDLTVHKDVYIFINEAARKSRNCYLEAVIKKKDVK